MGGADHLAIRRDAKSETTESEVAAGDMGAGNNGPVSTAAASSSLNATYLAAANGSNRIALRCLRLPGINALTCQNDLY